MTFGGLPYSPVTVTASKSLEALIGFGVGVGLGVALGLAEAVGAALLAGADGDGLGDAASSSPHAASSSDAESARTVRTLAGEKRTGKPYPAYAVARAGFSGGEVRPELGEVVDRAVAAADLELGAVPDRLGQPALGPGRRLLPVGALRPQGGQGRGQGAAGAVGVGRRDPRTGELHHRPAAAQPAGGVHQQVG